MDYRFDRIENHFEGCLRQAGVFERAVDGSQLFDVEMIQKPTGKWLVLAAGISDAESDRYFSDQHARERATVPMQLTPNGQARILLVVQPQDRDAAERGRYVTEFSDDVRWIELRQGCYVRIDELDNPAVRQIRWELDPVAGRKEPQEQWLRQWVKVVGCNPAHAPSHWHINSPPIERPGRRKRRQVINQPELRLATGLPNPLLLMLSLANWLRNASNSP